MFSIVLMWLTLCALGKMKGTERTLPFSPGQVSSDLEIQSTTNLHDAPREKVSEGSSPRDVQNITEGAKGGREPAAG